jgi:LDH2 family malate/lactate/ureidoglycolate dehydrogenase
MPTVSYEHLYGLAVAIYEAAGASTETAQTVARHQVGANLAGHDSHGIQLLPTYIQRIDRGHIQPRMDPLVIRETPTTIFVNGQWAFGPVVSEFTMKRCIAKAREVGVAVGVVREQSHVGRLADYPLMAVREGFISIMTCDSGQSAKAVAPFGGRVARLGTNPICIAFPSELRGPVFIDMATSAVAAGKLQLYRTRKQRIPEGWLVEQDGKPATDPAAFYERGAVMLPLGGPEGHKGYGLSFAVETLASLLPGLGFGIDPQGRHNDGSFMLVVDPANFQPLANFKAQVTAFVEYLKDTPPAEGFTEVLYPGELEYRTEQRRRAEGIPVEEDTWERVAAIAKRFELKGLGAFKP